MSYTTRCPACGTTFRVVSDQLKLSDGWVRCGHCSDVFDATLYLQAWTPPAPQAIPEPPPEPTESPIPEPEPVYVPAFSGAPESEAGPEPVMAPQADVMPLAEDPAPAFLGAPWSSPQQEETRERQAPETQDTFGPDGHELADIHEGPVGEEAPPAPVSGPCVDPSENPWLDEPLNEAPPDLPESPRIDDPSDGSSEMAFGGDPLMPSAAPMVDAPVETPEDFHAELARFAAGAGHPAPAEQAARSTDPIQGVPSALSEVPVDADSEDQDVPDEDGAVEPGFVRQARRQAFWRSPLMRGALLVIALLLSSLLSLQWVVQERDDIAARYPAAAQGLAAICQPLGCQIAPPRQIDVVEIDSSTLVRRLGNFYAFDVVLRNTADHAVATPALELSLTDTRDQVIARRVFLPGELPNAPPQLPADDSVSLSLRLSINDFGPLGMAGYRALVFYP